ncbi:EAL domain-containing protein [Iamia sp. SCSIO 61187]|uniref:hypothetical protein n=1 Tax=Iamia sp. SCSIO 61187 TaxID=2722752 RepID=UPI001C639867|nr:hypothetical protein [Iamia sp. SCSIO 61187]QYG91162.1 EAL domain-containing protein [Iamia sp. SCSIO 61187]
MRSPSHPSAPVPSCSCGNLVESIEQADDGTDPRLAAWRSTLADPRSMQCHYQPIFDVRTMEVVAHEALLRVTDVGTDVMIPPQELFGAAMDGGWHQALDRRRGGRRSWAPPGGWATISCS